MEPKPTLGRRVVAQHTMRLRAEPEAVFPLLCPVREYDWIEHWECELVHTASGFAEMGCVFRTNFPGDGPADWMCVRFEPPAEIAYVMHVPGRRIRLLEISLARDDRATQVVWKHTITGLGDDPVLDDYEARFQAMMRTLETSLAHYLETGELYRPDQAAA